MRLIRSALVVLVIAAAGVWAGIAFGQDAPKQAPPKAEPPAQQVPDAEKPAQKIAASDRWFIAKNGDDHGYLHITTKESGDPMAPVRVNYEVRAVVEDSQFVVTEEGLCLNDEWFSPVKLVSRHTVDMQGNSESYAGTFTRPDSKSTAGKVVVVEPNYADRVLDVKERTVMLFAPLEIVSRMPFEKEVSVKFARIQGVQIWEGEDCELSYAGKEELEIKGKKQSLHKFTQKIGDMQRLDLYWLNDKHEIVQAKINGGVLTPTTEAEARAAVKAKAPEPPEPKE